MTTPNPLDALANAPSTPEFRAGIIRLPERGKMPEMDTLPWQTVVDTLNRLAPGWRHTTTVCDGYVRVDITVADADGVATTRGSLATIAPSIAGGQIPPLETAERTAFKRAASYFGIHLPPGQPRQFGQSDRPAYNPRPQPDGDTGGASPGYCGCGVPISGNYAQCRACYVAPRRKPGICASCERNDVKFEFAQCYNCSQAKAPILPQYAAPAPSDGGGAIPADVLTRIQACRTLPDFQAMMRTAAEEKWRECAWAGSAVAQLQQTAERYGLKWDKDSREFYVEDDGNDLPW